MSNVPGCLGFGGFPDKPAESQSAESSQPGRPRNRGRQNCINRDGRSSETPGLRAFSAQAKAPVSESDNRGQNRTQRNEENPTARVRELRTKNSFAEAHLKVRVRVRNRARRIARPRRRRRRRHRTDDDAERDATARRALAHARLVVNIINILVDDDAPVVPRATRDRDPRARPSPPTSRRRRESRRARVARHAHRPVAGCRPGAQNATTRHSLARAP